MKRMLSVLLLLALLSAPALASLDYNSFMDDMNNAGRFDSFAWNGEYVYWLHAPGDGLDWTETPANLYRMRPGDAEAQCILQGGEDRWLYGLLNIGEGLLLSVAEENSGQTHPALVNFDGSAYKALSGNIGNVILYGGKIYNSVDGAIYEIDPEKMKPKKLYSYPAYITSANPVLTQREGMNLYFVTDTFDWYRLDLQDEELKKIAGIRGDGFALNFKFYIGDYDNGGTYCYDLATGKYSRISESAYAFLQGSGDYVRAKLMDPAGLGSSEGGRIFDMLWMTGKLEDALTGTCDPLQDVLLNGGLLHYDSENNRVEWSTEATAQRMQ